MTRKTLTALKTAMATAFADNNVGAITPALLRQQFNDAIDSLNTVIAMTYGTFTAVDVPLTATPSRLPVTFFTSAFNDDASVIEARINPNADVLLKSAVGQAAMAFDIIYAGGNGDDFKIFLYRNGLATGAVVQLSTTGVGNTNTISLQWFITDPKLNDSFTLWAATTGANSSLTVSGLSIKGTLYPSVV